MVKAPSKFKVLLRICLGVLFTLLTACNHYHLGNPGVDALQFRTIYVAPVKNNSFAPQAQVLLTDQIIQLLQQSGLQTTQHEEEADASLRVVLTQYDRVTSTTMENDTDIASSFYVTMVASCTLTDNNSECVYFLNRPISATINAQAQSSVQRVLYQDMPTLTLKLADQIRNLATSAW